MKIFRRIICFALALVSFCLSLTSCSNRMVMTGGGLTNKKTGVSYSYVLNPAYQPIEYSDEAYTTWKYNKITVEYVAIKGLKEEEWLYCPTLGEVLCATGEELPGLDPEIVSCLQRGVSAVPLSSLSALSTAFLNDVSPVNTFAQLVYALGKKGDVVLGLSTSGNSANVLNAIKTAKALGLKTIAFTGMTGGKLLSVADITIRVPETETYKVQELHLPVYHAICAEVESILFG